MQKVTFFPKLKPFILLSTTKPVNALLVEQLGSKSVRAKTKNHDAMLAFVIQAFEPFKM